MSVHIDQYRAVLGAFYPNSSTTRFIFRNRIAGWWDCLRFLSFLILLSGDVHPNPGPKLDTLFRDLNFAHVNLNSITVHPKMTELRLLCQLHQIDILAISETWLSANDKNESILIRNFKPPIRKDRSHRGGGVAIYINEMLMSKIIRRSPRLLSSVKLLANPAKINIC